MTHKWYEDAVFYHIYSFSLAGADFWNDYAGIDHKLSLIEKWIPHIMELGCNSVLLSPVMKARSHGYDVADYSQVDNRVGTNDDFRSLVTNFHEHGLRVVLDCVFNHCGRDFFAFQELLRGNRNYAAWFSGVDFSRQSPLGDPFTYDAWSGYYELVKFNLGNDATRRYLLDAARFWIDAFDIDGMRLDSANVMDFNFMRGLRQAVDEKKPDFWLMGEVVGGDYARWAAPGILDSVTNYILYKSLFSSHNNQNLFELAHCLQQSRPSYGLPLYNFLDNHDQPRIASNVFDSDHLRTLYALLYTVPGMPSIYYGSEWGIRGVKENGSDQPLRPYIDIANPPADDRGLVGYISSLATLRRAQSALRYGGYKQVYLEYRRPFVFERFYEDQRIFVAINIADSEGTVNLGSQAGGYFVDLLTAESVMPDPVRIPPHTARILKVE
ncbi:MAG: alpha-amylase [Peptococcaceae bacterium]|jgi:glycosidase|nr:alpha-amylase [Peptococcaceae bacterium]